MRRGLFRASLAAGLIVAACGATADQGPAPSSESPSSTPAQEFAAEELRFYEEKILPILQANCYECHGGEKVKGKLFLGNREALLKGGNRGPAISLQKPEESLLLQAVNYSNGLEMPPRQRLAKEQIELLTRWVKAGAPMPAGNATVKDTEPKGGVVTPEAKNYWAYKPVQRPTPPTVKHADWVRNPIDAFILAKLEAKGLKPAAPAEKVALIRRATYDLIGLPPAPEEVDAFVKDGSADAYEKLIDRLLASPHYGEKWGRYWLDLVRYAETNGYERDGPKPFAWRFRDYVIKSFNDDKPYDRFIMEQLAGDELDRDDPDCIIATGFYRLGLWDDEPVDPRQARYDELDDFVATTAQVFLGMTMNCARCHDHKIDPIPQKDYYRLLAFFQDVPHFSDSRNTSSRFNLTDISPPQERARYEREMKEREARLRELSGKMTRIEDEAIKKMPAEDQRASEGPERPRIVRKVPQFLDKQAAEEYLRLKEEADSLRKKPEPKREMALSVNNCTVPPPPTRVLRRGSPHAPGERIEPGFPEVLGTPAPEIPPPPRGARTAGRRIVLARWIASQDNPLTARVMANRLWQFHFGRGIVASPNDFGKFGTPPTHPELLDWLADELVAGGWKLKRMHKLIMTSSTYRMASSASAEGLKADPSNELWWRFSMRRLTAEEVRDSMLAVSGQLNLKMGGPSIYPPIPKEVLAGQSVPGQGWGKSPPAEAARRSIYIHVKRSLLVPLLAQHDLPDSDSSCAMRFTTTVPTQALGMLNSEFASEQAAAFAARLRKEYPNDAPAQVKRAIRLTTGRMPADEEINKDVAFLQALAEKHRLDDADALKWYCLMALNTNEFLYLD